MGDGDTVTCDGPGTPYSASDPDATTDCSYTWTAARCLHGDGDRVLVGDLDGDGRAGRREPRASRPGPAAAGAGDGDRVAGDQHPDRGSD